ncbi:MAG TPA: putative DNA-binding domain-containing protein [Opitutaceae bacterium]|jgi:hypothetical protein|nr:putative DNA-binding domain-containing protein [Opitutaceae bacterium]
MRRPPQGAGGLGGLRRLQRAIARQLVRPERPSAAVAAAWIKPNDQLTARERLEIYHRVYWFRLLGAALEDSPGLRALLGERRFERLMKAYLSRHPSRSFTMRNLLSRLPEFIRRHPRLTAPKTAAALAVARFEWAQTEAFDGPAWPAISPEAAAKVPAERLRIGIQPYISLIDAAFAVDEFVLAVKRRDALRAEASNTQVRARRARKGARVTLRRGRSFIAVHRYDNQLYYKRLDAAQYRVLTALRRGRPLARALAASGRRVRPEEVRAWFETWMKLGWLCRPGPL